nr:MAG TPA: hypothetical protein [Bacteriophage sp.]
MWRRCLTNPWGSRLFRPDPRGFPEVFSTSFFGPDETRNRLIYFLSFFFDHLTH